MAMTGQTDNADHAYVETPTLTEAGEEHVRTTLIPAKDSGYGEDSIRIQIRDYRGHLRQGPEVPLSAVSGMIAAIVDLIREG